MTTDTVTTNPTADSPRPDGDPRASFARAVALAGSVIGAVRPEQMDDPTPCGDKDVRSLLGHLVEVLDRVELIGRGENPFAVAARSVPDDAWLATWHQAAHDVQAAWSDDRVLERIVVLPWSQVSGGETLGGYVNEVTVHTWDLAVATGQQPAWDEQVLAVAFGAIRRILPATDRAAAIAAAAQSMPPERRSFPPPFAEAVDVATDAPLIDRLVAFNGRDPKGRTEGA